jgi:hypothetical protein
LSFETEKTRGRREKLERKNIERSRNFSKEKQKAKRNREKQK